MNAFSIFFITVPLQDPPHDRTPSTLVADTRAGIGWLWGQPLLRHLNLLAAGRTAVASGLCLLIIVLARHDHASSAAIGGIFAVSALGGILGAAVASRLHQRLQARSLLWMTTGLTWILVSCCVLASNVVLLTVITAGVYFAGPLFEIAVATCTADAVPDAMRGRVSSAVGMRRRLREVRPR